MSDGEISVRFTSEEDAKLWDAFVKVAQKSREAGKALGGTSNAADSADASLKRFAERTRDLHATPLERVTAEVKRLDQALAKSLLTQEEHRRATTSAHQAYFAGLKKQQEEAAAAATAANKPVPMDPAMKALGARLTEDNSTPLERYNARILRVRQAYQATAISAETLRRESVRALQDLNKELAKTDDKATEADRDLKKFAATVREVETTPIQRYNQQLVRLNEAYRRNMITQREAQAGAKRAADEYQAEMAQSERATRRVGNAAKETASSSTQAFGAMQIGITGAFAAVTMRIKATLDDIKSEAEKAGQSLAAQSKQRGNLIQFSDTKEEYDQLKALSRQVRQSGAAKTMGEAESFVSALKNADALKETEWLAKLKAYGILDTPEELVTHSTAVRTSFGIEQAGSFRDVLNRAFVAGGPSPANAAQVLKGTEKAGVMAAMQGASVDETMAIVGVLSRATGSAEEAGTMLESLYKSLATYVPKKDDHGKLKPGSPLDEEFRGQSMAQIIANPRLAALTPDKLLEIMGRTEAVNALGVIRTNWKEIAPLISDVRKGAGEDRIATKIKIAESDVPLMAAVRAEQSKGRAEVSSEFRGAENLVADAVQEDLRERMRETQMSASTRRMWGAGGGILPAALARLHGSEFGASLENQAVSATRWAVGDQAFMRGTEKTMDWAAEWGLVGKRQEAAAEASEAAARKQQAAAESLDRVSRRLEAALATPRPVSSDLTRAARAEAARAPE